MAFGVSNDHCYLLLSRMYACVTRLCINVIMLLISFNVVSTPGHHQRSHPSTLFATTIPEVDSDPVSFQVAVKSASVLG